MKRFIFSVAVLFSMFSMIAGCGPKKPDGLPKLSPCTINITQAGAPLSGTTISLISKGDPCKWMVGGLTDVNGVAKIKTHGLYDGAPAGMTFAVVLTKSDEEIGGPGKPTKVYAIMDPKYQDPAKTPFEIKIEGKGEQTFDVEKYTRTLVETIPTPASSEP